MLRVSPIDRSIGARWRGRCTAGEQGGAGARKDRAARRSINGFIRWVSCALVARVGNRPSSTYGAGLQPRLRCFGHHRRRDPRRRTRSSATSADEARLQRRLQIIEHLIGDRPSWKGAAVPATTTRYSFRLLSSTLRRSGTLLCSHQRICEVRLPGQRTQAGELGQFDVDQVVARRIAGFGKGLELATRARAHRTRSAEMIRY